MANAMATGWLQYFKERRTPSMFLSSFFTTKPGGIFNGTTVEIDVQRFMESVAVVIKRGTGANLNDAAIITTKEFDAPVYGEAYPTNVEDLLNREIGVDPYTDAGTALRGKLVSRVMDYFMLAYDMIVRGVELQASQILQTGRLNLLDRDGVTGYELDFNPKSTHFPTASTGWNQSGADPLADLESLCEVIRQNGKLVPDTLILGARALRDFMRNTEVQQNLDNRRVNIAEISPRQAISGATFQGYVWVGSYELAIWTYNEYYTDPQSGSAIKYLADDKAIILKSKEAPGAPATRLDRISTGVPLPLGPDPRLADLNPGRITDVETDIDVVPNVYCSNDGREIMAEVQARVVLAPIQIDGFGCLTTR